MITQLWKLVQEWFHNANPSNPKNPNGTWCMVVYLFGVCVWFYVAPLPSLDAVNMPGEYGDWIRWCSLGAGLYAYKQIFGAIILIIRVMD